MRNPVLKSDSNQKAVSINLLVPMGISWRVESNARQYNQIRYEIPAKKREADLPLFFLLPKNASLYTIDPLMQNRLSITGHEGYWAIVWRVSKKQKGDLNGASSHPSTVGAATSLLFALFVWHLWESYSRPRDNITPRDASCVHDAVLARGMCYSVGARGQRRLEGNSRAPELKKRG